MRRMSFAHTTDAVRTRTKTVTRRLGWLYLKPGDRLLAVDKIRVKNVERLGVIEVVNVRRESLYRMHESDVAREGFDMFVRCDSRPEGPHHGFPASDCVHCFYEMFEKLNKLNLYDDCTVTRIEFRYVNDAESEKARTSA